MRSVMLFGEKPMTATPRYLKATVVSTLAAAVVPAVLIAIVLLDLMSGPPVEASEAQGGLIILVHLLTSILFVAVAFPLVSWLLCRRAGLTRHRFYRAVFMALVGVALVPGAVLAVVGFGVWAFVLAPASFAALALLSLPARSLWWRLAQ